MPQPPRIKSMELAHLALPQKRLLPNGVVLYMLDGGVQDVVRFDMLFGGGYGVQDMPLQAMFTNRMLREGCEGVSAQEFSRRLDYYGAWVDMYSSQNCNHITLYALSKHLPAMLELVCTMVKAPLFPKKNLETVRKNNKSFFTINSRKVDVVSQRYFERALWGSEHRFGRLVEAADYDAITREALFDYHSRVYNSRNCTLFLSGRVNDNVLEAVTACLGSDAWGGEACYEPLAQEPPSPLLGRNKIVVDGVMQSAVKIGCMAMESSHPDFLKFRFLTVLFGGYFGSRLMSNIRERNGFTYHIQAELDAYGTRNALMVSSETANDTVQPLIAEVYKEMERLRNERVSRSELELVRNYTLGELCREYEGVLAKSDLFINTLLSGEPFESVNSYIDVVRTVESDELQRVACEYLRPERMCEIIAGA